MNAIASSSDKLFIAITDELLYEHPEHIEGPLVPYSSKMDCHHWLDIEINPSDLSPLNALEDTKLTAIA